MVKGHKIDKKLFADPPAEYRGAPFWAWNGKLKKEELLRQIHIFKEMGMGGFFMHSRAGLQTEYLGDEWMAMIRLCAEEAAKLGMKAYLYDEDRWPSGTAGGLVTQNPRFREKYFTAETIERENFNLLNFGQEYIAAFAVKLIEEEGEEALADYFPILYADQIPDGYTALVFTAHERPKEGFFNGSTDVDRLNREATDEFIRITHEKYKAAVGDMFGKEILGIFEDEPHRGFIFGGPDSDRMPYTYTLFETFEKYAGYDLKGRLPELFYKKTGEAFNKTAYDYVDVLDRMFIDNFARPYSDWCRENRLILTGHIWQENNLVSQTRLSGSAQRFYEYMDYPGVDVLNNALDNFWIVKQCYSVAKQLKKPFVLSELYGCSGWQTRFEDYKRIGDWQAVLGVNLRCHHLSWYTMEGEAKRDYPASIFYQSAWFDRYKYVEDYFSRLNYILSSGEAATSVAVINPIESAWGMVRTKCFCGYTAAFSDMQSLERDFACTFHALTDGGVDFDYVDEDILSRYGKVEANTLKVGSAAYSTVVVSGLITIRKSTLDFLNRFAAAGGKVVVYKLPKYVGGIRTEIDGGSFIETVDISSAAEEAEKNIALKVSHPEGILSHIRKVGGDYFAALVNSERGKDFDEVEIHFNLPYNAEEWSLRDGGITGCNFEKDRENVTIKTSLKKGDERLFRLTKAPVEPMRSEKTGIKIALPSELNYELSEPNVLVLDIAKYYIDGGYEGKDEILKIDRSLRKKFGLEFRGGAMVQPWFKEKFFRRETDKTFCRLALEYTIEVRNLPNGEVMLALETPEKFDIKLNGISVGRQVCGTYVDNSVFRIRLPDGILNIGKNTLRLECDFSDGMNLEAVYLLGSFGVDVKGHECKITKLPERVDSRPLKEQGLPFYGGKIKIFTGITSGIFRLKFPQIRGVYYEADFGCEKEVIAFTPYESSLRALTEELTFTLCLTRRNTFGPLHYVNTDGNKWYGPREFLTEGEKFSLDYVFIDEGIDIPSVIG